MAKKFKLNERVWSGLSKKLQAPGKIDEFMKTGDCPVCLTKTYDDGSQPFIVEKELLHFHCRECSISGGPINYFMITRKISGDEAITFLEQLAG